LLRGRGLKKEEVRVEHAVARKNERGKGFCNI
jgi:hypothetical protein